MTALTIDLMRSMSDFAVQVRQTDLAALPYFRCVVYGVASVVLGVYVWPLVAYFRCGNPAPVPPDIQRRAVSFPAVLTIVTMLAWSMGSLFFPTYTIFLHGRWSTDLMSQQVLSPLINGFLAATTAYLVVDWIFRVGVIPHVFPGGKVTDVPGAFTMSVRTRLLVFLGAVAFIPLFTMLGLARTAQDRYAAGVAIDDVLGGLAAGSTGVFFVYAALGVFLTLALARTFTGPLSEVVTALRRVRGGDLSVRVHVESGDEVGQLQDGVNDMIDGLREKDRILDAFGRVVEPTVRDRLLAGAVAADGEARRASVMFCDLRGFTAMAEHAPPEEVLATLNEFFTAMTVWVRDCGGFVDKFIGDALLVVFGLFDEEADGGDGDAHAGAVASVRCALGVRDRLVELNASRAASGRSPLAVSMAVHTGQVLAGTIGASDRHEFTVIGDTVNIAARLQQLARDRGVDLVVSDDTYGLASGNGLVTEVALRDSVVPRGRNQSVGFVALA